MRVRSGVRLAVGALVAASVGFLQVSSAGAAAAVPVPLVTTPPAVGTPWNASIEDLNALGVTEQEFFFAGATTLGPYKSRMLVRTPSDPARFNGTVIVEWFNASSLFDAEPDGPALLPLVARDGYAYVGVTAQQIPIDFLRNRFPDRYGTLTLTEGGSTQPAALEVFAQAGMALRDDVIRPAGSIDPLAGFDVKRLIATGQSQSSTRLTTFVNTIHGAAFEPVYDAFVLNAGGAAPTRFAAPIIKINSENEAPNYFRFRNVADPSYRVWEVAGADHTPVDAVATILRNLDEVRGVQFPRCPFPYQGPGGPPSTDPVIRTAVVQLDTWLGGGPAAAPSVYIDAVASPTNPNVGVLQRDQYGNSTGGVRLPQQVVPTGRNSPAFACQFTTFPQWDEFNGNADPAQDPTDVYTEPASVKALYRNHGGYVSRFGAAVRAAVDSGYLLPADGELMHTDAAQSDIAK